MPRKSHKQLERSRKDDLESWLYLACEFFRLDVLPWANESIYEEVCQMKGVFMSEIGFKHILDVCAGLPRPTATIARLINVLQYDTAPDYRLFKAIFKNAIIQGNYEGDKLDWVKETANEQQLHREKREELMTELNADTAHGGHFKVNPNNAGCGIEDIIERNFTSNDNTHSHSRETTLNACSSRSSTSSKSDKRGAEKITKKRKHEGRRCRSTEPKLNAKSPNSKSLMLLTAKILKKKNRSQGRAEKQKEKMEKRRDSTARCDRDTGKEFTALPIKRIRSTSKAKQIETNDVEALGTELKSTLKPPK